MTGFVHITKDMEMPIHEIARLGCTSFDCPNIDGFIVDSENTDFSSDEYGILYNKDKTKLVRFPRRCELRELIIDEGVNFIAEGECPNLEKITVDQNNLNYSSDDAGILFNKDGSTLLRCPGKKEAYSIPDGVTSIDSGAFSGCALLKQVDIPDTVTGIGDEAFRDCVSLDNVVVKSGTHLGDYCFKNCSGLKTLSIGTNCGCGVGTADNGSQYYDANEFRGCTNIETLTITGTGFLNCGYRVITNMKICPWTDSAQTLKTIIISEGVEGIGYHALYGLNPSSITLPNSLKTIEKEAISTGEVTELTIPKGIKSIDGNAFRYGNSMKKIVLKCNPPLIVTNVLNGSFDLYYPCDNELWDEETRLEWNSKTEKWIPDHDYSDWSIVIDPSCTESGSKHKICSKCNDEITESIPKTAHTFDEWETTKEATCTSPGIKERTCSDCGQKDSETIPAPGHQYGAWKTTKVATEIAAGQQSRQCTVCGKTETKSIAQLKPSLPSVKISKPKAAKKSATIKWKKVSKKNQKKIAKIEIQYSTDKTFKTSVKTVYAKKSAASKKIKKLASKKTYYVRIRAYIKSGGIVHVSNWSATKPVKAK